MWVTAAGGECPQHMVRRRRVAVAVLSLCVASLLGWWVGREHDLVEPRARVLEAIDGDTLRVVLHDGGRDTVRLLGVDTPETHHPLKGVQCFGPEAAAYTARRLTGRVVRLEPDVERRDIYGRRLAYVIVHGRRFDDELLRRGYARLLVIPPNRAHARAMLAAELWARRHDRGLWHECE